MRINKVNIIFRTFLIIFVTTLLLTGNIASAKSAPLNIVVSIAPLQALAQGILGDKGTVTQLVPANMSPHSYTLKPVDLSRMSNADMIIWIGPQLEFFLNKPIERLQSTKKVLTVIEVPGLTLYNLRVGKNWQASDHDHKDGLTDKLLIQPFKLDPHLWLNPDNAIIILDKISTLLQKLDPKNQEYYATQLTNRKKELLAVDNKIKQDLISLNTKPFLVFHDGYQYFEKHYHLDDLGTVMANPEIPLSGKQLQEIHEKIQTAKIICVFTEPQTNEKLANSIVSGTQAHLGMLDPLDSGLPQGWQGYTGLLEKNAAALKKCLGP